jgi:hypothetical protein
MEKLLELLDNFIAYILYGGEEELHKYKQLRKIWKDLKNRQLRYVDKRGNKVNALLPSRILHLYRLIQTLDDLFSLNKESEELLEDEKLLTFLITSRLDESAGADRSAFTYDRLRERVAPLEDQQQEWKKIEKELEQYLGQLDTERFFGFNDGCFGLEQLYSLLRYDYLSLLNQFSGSSGDLDSAMHPSFIPTSSDQVEQELLDLYFILADFEVSPALRTMTEDLLRYHRKNSDSNLKVLRETLDQMELFLENDLSEPIFRGLIQLVRQDPYYDPEYMKRGRNYLEEYAKGVRERFGHNRDRLRRELLQERVELKVEKIFGEQELLSAGGYNRETDQYLAEHNFPCFSHLHPLEILKSYVQWKLTKGFLGSLKKIAEDGYFEDRNFRLHYEDAVQRCAGIGQEIEQFEQFIHGRGGLSIEDVRKMVERGGLKNREAQSIQRFVEEANGNAKKLVEKATNSLFALYREVETVLVDFRSNNPKHVSNIRVIGGEKNSDMMEKVKASHAELGELLAVLRNYAVIYQEEKREQEENQQL